jgi:hypothetical protein
VLASCVNTSASCGTLLSTATADGTATGTNPADTATVAINIAHNPGANVRTLYVLASGTSSFAGELTAVPNDLTLAVSFKGGGLNYPTGLAVDGNGDVWVANFSASNNVTELASNGSILSGLTGFTGGGMNVPGHIAIDASGDAWVAGQFNGVVELSPTGTIVSGASGFYGYISPNSPSIVGPSGIAIDGSGNVWIPSLGGLGGTSEFTNSGYFLGWNPSVAFAEGVAVSPSNVAWVPGLLSNSVALVSSVTSPALTIMPGGGLDGPSQIAFDSGGNAWIGNYRGNSVSEIAPNGTALSGSSGFTAGGLEIGTWISMDGASNVWVASSCLVEFSNSGSALSGASCYLSGNSSAPFGGVVDGSGDLWLSLPTSNAVEELIGVAVPVVTPLAMGVKNNMLGTRP